MDRQTKNVVIAVVVLAVVIRLIFLGVSLANLPATGDECISGLLAKHIAHGRFPLLFMAQPYQFPIDSYLLAPLARIMPRNAFGIRYETFLLGFLGVLGGWLILRSIGPLRETWPGVLLILFPSAYVLLIQAAYALPQHAFLGVFWSLAVWFAFLTRGRSRRTVLALSFFTGLISGLGYSTHLLSVSVLAAAVLFLLLDGGWRGLPVRIAGTASGLVLGLIPYLAVRALYPNAYMEVVRRRSPAQALLYAWDPLIPTTLPGTMGITPICFPDLGEVKSLWPALGPPFGFLVVGLLAVAAVLASVSFVRRTIRRKWPSLDPYDVFILASWMGLALFALSYRSRHDTYRYLLPVAWSFPFVIAFLYGKARGGIRTMVGGFAVLLAGFNVATAVMLIHVWSRPDFARTQADTPEIRSALEYLEDSGIRSAFASYWTAYRIDYLTDEAILCAQPYNERFSFWPLPYFDEVHADRDAVYVLNEIDRFRISRFERDLAEMGVTSRRTMRGDYAIYEDFRFERDGREERIPPGEFDVVTSHNPSAAAALHDGDRSTKWKSAAPQQEGMWIEIRFPGPCDVNRVSLIYHHYPYDQAGALRLLRRSGGAWEPVLDRVPAKLDPFEFENGHPLYGERLQTLRFEPVRTDALRLEIAECDPNPRKNWSVTEIEVYREARKGENGSGKD